MLGELAPGAACTDGCAPPRTHRRAGIAVRHPGERRRINLSGIGTYARTISPRDARWDSARIRWTRGLCAAFTVDRAAHIERERTRFTSIKELRRARLLVMTMYDHRCLRRQPVDRYAIGIAAAAFNADDRRRHPARPGSDQTATKTQHPIPSVHDVHARLLARQTVIDGTWSPPPITCAGDPPDAPMTDGSTAAATGAFPSSFVALTPRCRSSGRMSADRTRRRDPIISLIGGYDLPVAGASRIRKCSAIRAPRHFDGADLSVSDGCSGHPVSTWFMLGLRRARA